MKSLTLLVLAAAGVIAGSAIQVSAAPPQPTFGTAVVDGDPSEWNLTTDHFAEMHRAGKAAKPVDSQLYVRYDCNTATVFVLVLAEPGEPALFDTATAWCAVDGQNHKVFTDQSGNDGTAPDFAWIDLGYDGDPTHALGYEASFPLGDGTFDLIAHVDVYAASAGQTSATIGFPGTGVPLDIDCGTVPTEAVSWSRVKALYR